MIHFFSSSSLLRSFSLLLNSTYLDEILISQFLTSSSPPLKNKMRFSLIQLGAVGGTIYVTDLIMTPFLTQGDFMFIIKILAQAFAALWVNSMVDSSSNGTSFNCQC